MDRLLTRRSVAALLIQLVGMLGAVGAVAVAPPERGRMMLVPLHADAARGMIGLAVAHGASLVGPGLLPGSVVVEGDRAALSGALARHGVALVAASASGCAA